MGLIRVTPPDNYQRWVIRDHYLPVISHRYTNFTIDWCLQCRLCRNKVIRKTSMFSINCLLIMTTIPKIGKETKHCQRHNGPEGWVHLAKVISQVQTQTLIEFHLQNLDSASTRKLNQTSASPLNLKFKILIKPSFRISTKILLHNLYKTSAAKCWTNSSFKILPKLQLQTLTNLVLKVWTKV